MRPLIDRVVPALTAPDDAVLEEARAASPERGTHDGFIARIEALHEVEQRAPASPVPWPGRLRIAALNAERLKDRAAVRRMLDRTGAHLVLLSEADAGMVRSGNVHTVRELAEAAGEGYLYGVEFVELDLGDKGEMRRHAGERNALGFHGNAIVSGLSLEDAHLIPLEENGLWFPGRNGAQRRIGGRMALAARIVDAPRPLWVVSVHLESKTDPQDRQAQMRNLLRALDSLAPDEPCIIGGDFNTKALPRGEDERHLLLQEPERFEPLFADLRAAGFAWSAANLARPTQNPGPSNKHAPPFGKLDWIVTRGVTPENPQVHEVTDGEGGPVSDHDMLVVDIAP
ncbi:endonuclease/exonuclease/phosphatase family protein [Microvirga roseola]|uniref:endonuclease/exonuclease/phosphatase family protein n=1 Tax=Microvirga roseola TaxID=2883126 RepID=UPI001E614B3D|nr:endonuclease/exonuclease/phosphatase family protein [Microvirga roseola]